MEAKGPSRISSSPSAMKVDSPKASIGIYCHDIGEAILRPWEAAGGQQTDNGGLSCSLSSLLRSGIYLTSCSILPLRPRETERERAVEVPTEEVK